MGIIPAGMNFWNPWPTWEKLTFVLGCGIFFVFIAGFAVKFRNARKIRKLEARAAADLAERGEVTERASEEVPFGIRAIEAGDEVDGIWNSRAATPLQAPSPKSFSEPSTPNMKPHKLQKTRKFGSESSLSKLELPESARVKPLCPKDAPTPSEPSANAPTTATYHENLTVPQVAFTPCPVPGKRRIVIGGRPLTQKIPEKVLVSARPNTIERMQAHRKQMSAETGQLERRVRRVASANSKLAAAAPASDNGSDLTDSRTLSWPSSKSESSATPIKIRCEVIPLPSFVEGDAGSKKTPPTAWSRRTGELVEEKLEKSKLRSPTGTIHLTPENLSHLNENHRKVNNGFEILPAGTLAKPAPIKEFGLWPERSIHMVSDQDTKPTRKLQKRNRSRSGSRSRRSSSDGGLSERGN